MKSYHMLSLYTVETPESTLRRKTPWLRLKFMLNLLKLGHTYIYDTNTWTRINIYDTCII